MPHRSPVARVWSHWRDSGRKRLVGCGSKYPPPCRPVRHASAHRCAGDVQPPRRRMGAAVADRRAVRYDISFDPTRGRAAMWTPPGPPHPHQRSGSTNYGPGRVLGVDLNADHLAACVLDASGNLIGAPVTIAVETTGLRASRCDGRVRAAITATGGSGRTPPPHRGGGGEPRAR